MTDHFSITVDVAELTNAMTKFGWLADHVGTGGEGGKLASLKGDPGSWTGAAATSCLGEMGTIATTMTGAAPKFTTAHDAVQTFRSAVETAQNDTLPKLNTRWSESESDYTAAVSKADKALTDYANTANGTQSANAGEHAQDTHDQAVTSAGTTRAATQKSINTDYDSMMTTLHTAAKTCGTALTDATVVKFTAEQWAQVKGGGPMPIGVKFALRAEAFGPDTILHHSDGIVVGDYVGKKLNDEAGKKLDTDLIDPELVELMKQFGGDKAFSEGLLTTLGPGGTAYLAFRVNELLSWSDTDGAKNQGQALMPIISTILKTGSDIDVTQPDGSTKPLMDKAWLDGFDPRNYSSLSPANKGVMEGSTNWPTGYQPGLLLPFLSGKDAVSPRFSTLIAQRALEDYEAAHKDGELQWDSDAGRRWALYGGFGINADYNTRTGKTDDPFAYDVFHIAMERASDYGSSSNAVMMGHRDTMMMLMTGGDPSLVGGADVYGDRHDWMSGTLGTILKQATIGYEGVDPSSADAVLWGTADYLQNHDGTHLLHNVNVALGDVVTDPRMFNGAMSSVTGPDFTGGHGYLDDPSHPGAGPLMSPALWATLHQEAMLHPETAATLIKETGQYINGTSDGAQHLGYTWDPETKQLVQNTHVTSLSLYQAEAARHFLGQNLLTDHDQLVKNLQDELDQNHQNKEQAKAIVGQLVDWAKDPTSIKDDVIGKLTDFAVDKVVDWGFPSDEDIEKKYNGSIASLQSDLDNAIVKPGFWDDVNQTANQLVKDDSSGAGTTDTDSVVPGYTSAGDHKVFTGDPSQYVGKSSSYENGHVVTDDFLTYDASTGKPNGVVPPTEMNSLQRTAYENWLHDPAVQAYLEGKNEAIAKAREQAGR